MIMLDNTVVNVALPTIQRDLGAQLSELEWIVTAYALTFAALLLTGGKLADLLGRRLIFVAGLAVFASASLACALAPSAGFLIGARAVQGVGGALLNPASLSIVAATFPPRERGMAIGIWAGVSASALAVGPLVGGLLTEHVGWSSIFFVNVPIGAVAIVASLLLIDESRDTSEVQRLDPLGLLTSGLGLFALTYALIEGNSHGWSSDRIVGAFTLAVLALAAFVVLELRQRHPMLDLGLFRNTTFLGANIVFLLVVLAMFGVLFFVSLYLQNVLGYSPVKAGAAFLPMTLAIVLVAPLAGRLSDRVGSRWLITGGLLLVSTQLFYLSRLGVEESYWALVPAMLMGGIGMASAMPSATAAALSGIPGREGRCRLGCRQHLSTARRLARDRADGGDRGARGRRPAVAGRVRPRALSRARSRGRDRTRRRSDRRGAHPLARRAARPLTSRERVGRPFRGRKRPADPPPARCSAGSRLGSLAAVTEHPAVTGSKGEWK